MRRSRFPSAFHVHVHVPVDVRVRALVLAGVLAAATGCAAETDERPANFTYIVDAILTPSCATATCHSAMPRREDMDFSDVDAAAASMTRGGLVQFNAGPGLDPNDTQLVFLLTTTGEKRKPLDSPLPDADVDLIRAWIADGAVR
jgi:hypothetical protein